MNSNSTSCETTARAACAEPRPCVLSIAGSDSGGNAGVQADLRAFHAYGLHGCTVFSALTAQNPSGVSAIHGVPPGFLSAQLAAVLGTYSIRALKTGMLGTPENIEAVVAGLRPHPGIAKVIDPVMVATSGAKLAGDDAVAVLKRELIPLATVITPNIPEAAALLGERSVARTQRDMAKALYELFGVPALVKGGHAEGEPSAVDVLCDGAGELREYSAPRIDNPVSTHGTGCSFAAALAAELALSHSLYDAVAGAKEYVRQAIACSYLVGENCGVLGFVQ